MLTMMMTMTTIAMVTFLIMEELLKLLKRKLLNLGIASA
jgi:hypothetical protein